MLLNEAQFVHAPRNSRAGLSIEILLLPHPANVASLMLPIRLCVSNQVITYSYSLGGRAMSARPVRSSTRRYDSHVEALEKRELLAVSTVVAGSKLKGVNLSS